MIREIPEGKYCCYRHVRLDNNTVFYIGIGSRSSRPKEVSRRSKHWTSIFNKINGNYRIDILFDNVSKEFAVEKEIELIALYGRNDLGNGTLCNHTKGGDGVIEWSNELREKNRQGSTGRKRSPETQAKMSKILKGYKHSDESRKNMSDARKGIKLSDVTKEKLRQINLGKKYSEEVKAKHRLRKPTQSKPVLNTDTGIYYESIKECAESIGLSAVALRKRLLKGKHKNIVVIKN